MADIKDKKKDEISNLNENLDNEPVVDEIVEDDAVADDESLPFPMATVVRQVKKKTHNKMISSKVKVAMNEFLGGVVGSVSEEMGKTRYSMIEMDDFQRATKPYTYAKELEQEKERVVSELEKMKDDLEALIREFERKFALASVDDFSVMNVEKKTE
jgi:hypothetical protein